MARTTLIKSPNDLTPRERKTGEQRLLKLVELLRSLPPKRFNYVHWVGSGWKGDPNLSCGTTACALGWATVIPALRREGLRLEEAGAGTTVSMNGAFFGEEAGAAAFRLTPKESRFLFLPGNIRPLKRGGWASSPPGTATAKQVAKHIKWFIAHRDELSEDFY